MSKFSAVVLGVFLFLLMGTTKASGIVNKSELVVCNVGFLSASSQMDDDRQSEKMGTTKTMKVVVDDMSGSTVQYVSPMGQNVEFSLTIDSDENVKGVYETHYMARVNEKKEIFSGFLLKYSGISSGGGWNFGPKGAKLLKLLFPDSLGEKALDLQLTYSASQVLKKYGVQKSKENANTYELFKAIAKAVKKGDLKEGEFIGTAFLFGCYN